MRPYRESHITRIALIIFFLFVLGYAYFEARGLIFGPSITLEQTFATTSDPYLEIKGATAHISDLKLDGGSIPVTEDGRFDQPFILSPGYNRIVLDAQDKYGKTAQKVIEIVYTPDESAENIATSTLPVSATSTTATSTNSKQGVTPASSPVTKKNASSTAPIAH